MMTNSLTRRLTEKRFWYIATVCSFVLGWTIGWMSLDSLPRPYSRSILMWVPPPALAGLAMGFGQWVLIRRLHKFSFLWIPITAVGLIASTGAALTLVLALPAYLEGSFPYKFDGLLKTFTPLAPIALLIGPLCQGLLLRSVLSRQAFKEIIKLVVGWLVATFLPFFLGYLLIVMEPFIKVRTYSTTVGAMLALGILSGFVFGLATEWVIHPVESNTGASFYD